MQLPGANASSSVYLSFAYHVQGAADAWADVEIITADQQKAVFDVGAMLKPAVDALRAAAGAADETARLATMALARFRVRDAVLDLRVMAAGDAVLNGPGLRNRQSPVYKQVFAGDNAGDITRARMRDEPELAGLLASRLDKVDDFEGKAAVHKALTEAVQKSLAARDAADAASLTANKAGSDELSARLALRVALEKVYGTLRSSFPGRRDFVESFFPRTERTAPKGGTAGEGEPEAGAGG